jgi:secernin
MRWPDHRYVSSCDTIVAFTGSADRRRAVFAKNSDRPILESQPLTQVAAADHKPGATVNCQYLSIPQVPRTLAVLGSRPWWLWGFEHGVNEAGVAIGNEAIYTRDPVPGDGLLGMDLVRLGLERGGTAAVAKSVITTLLERHGQGGSAAFGTDRRYHNSFIVADPSEAWVIETSGRRWVARRTTRGATIANFVSIEDDWDECSEGIEGHARARGYWSAPAGKRLDFRAAYEDAEARMWTEDRYRVGCRLLADVNEHDVAGMMRYLRDHFEAGLVNGPQPAGSPPRRTVCLHPGITPNSTAASMVVELATDDLPPVAWVSMGTPCTGIFLPVAVGQRLPRELEVGGEDASPDSAWWLMRELQIAIDRDPSTRAPAVQAMWAAMERELLSSHPRLNPDLLERLSAEVMERGAELILRLTAPELASRGAVAST